MPPHEQLKLSKLELLEEAGSTVSLTSCSKPSPEPSPLSPSQEEDEDDCCITIPPLLQQLFGVTVLPERNALVVATQEAGEGNDIKEVFQEELKVESVDKLAQAVKDDDESTLASITTASRTSSSTVVEEPKKKRKSALKRLKKSLRRKSKGRLSIDELSIKDALQSDHVRERAMTTDTLQSMSWSPSDGDDLLIENSHSDPQIRIALVEARVAHTQREIQELQIALTKSFESLDKDQALLAEARRSLRSSVSLPTSCESYMRVNDLNLDCTTEVFFSLDENLESVLSALSKLGHETVMSEGIFKPLRETEKMLAKGNIENEVLVWNGTVTHKGFGSNLPVLKARGVLNATPREVLDLILDNGRVQEYNKMSLGRKTVCVLMQDDHNSDDPRLAKITCSLNKPPFVRKTIEMRSLLYAHAIDDNGSFLLTSRSVWEQDHVVESPKKNVLRSEMLLGVNLLRPSGENKCEMTTITHVYSPGVPEMLARSFAPTAAVNFIKDIQQVFA